MFSKFNNNSRSNINYRFKIMVAVDVWIDFFNEDAEIDNLLKLLEGQSRLYISQTDYWLISLHLRPQWGIVFRNNVKVLPITQNIRQRAEEQGWKNFQAAINDTCAQENEIHLLVTRNTQNYEGNEQSFPLVMSVNELSTLLSLNSNGKTLEEYGNIIVNEFIKTKTPGTALGVDVRVLHNVQNNPQFARQVDDINVIVPSGRPLLSLLHNMGKDRAERVRGVDLLQWLDNKSQANSYNTYLISDPSEFFYNKDQLFHLVKTSQKIKTLSGTLILPLSDDEELSLTLSQEHRDEINNLHVDLVIVALPYPKILQWLYLNKNKIDAFIVGISCIDLAIYLELLNQPPSFLKNPPSFCENLGLEWLYHLYRDKRLFNIYFKTHPWFIKKYWKETLNLQSFQNPLNDDFINFFTHMIHPYVA